MPTRQEYFDLLNQLAEVRERLADLQAAERPGDATTAELINKRLADLQTELSRFQAEAAAPADLGFARLIGLGPEASGDLGEARIVPSVLPYDETVTSERLLAIADLYYIYQHERTGVFRAIFKLQELFKAGQVRLSAGQGAVLLYQYDRKRALHYTGKERFQAYRRVFGYTNAAPPAGSKPNNGFHRLFLQFNGLVAQYFRDKRVSEVVRPADRADTFGSVAVVRRGGLDLRSNLKHASYGHVNVLTVEVSQLLEQAFKILGAEDVRRLFGADNAWDTFEEILRQYLGGDNRASQRSRLGIAGREVIQWLAQPHVLNSNRSEFETLLGSVGEFCEEWLTSAQSLGSSVQPRQQPQPTNVVPMRRQA